MAWDTRRNRHWIKQAVKRDVLIGDIALSISARYKMSSQTATISGPGGFNKKGGLTYTVSSASAGTSVQYTWYLKYDFNSVWQNIGSGTSKSISISAVSNAYNFNLRVYMRNLTDTIGVWSDEYRVTCLACGGGGYDDPNQRRDMADAGAEEDSVTHGEWWPVNADTLAIRHKRSILRPIRDAIRMMNHRFRWKKNDAFTMGNNDDLIEDEESAYTEKNEPNESSIITEHIAQNDKISKKQENGDPAMPFDQTPKRFALYEAYPNPFNPSTTLAFDVIEKSEVSLIIYNTLGQTVRRLITETRSSGHHRVLWDGKNDSGVLVPSGVYIYQLRAGNNIQSRKMIFMK